MATAACARPRWPRSACAHPDDRRLRRLVFPQPTAQASALGALIDGVWPFLALRELSIDASVVGNHELLGSYIFEGRALVQRATNANAPESQRADPDARLNGRDSGTADDARQPFLGPDVWGRDARRLRTELLSDREV
jgi:hypothetical protein